ncbi:MAG: T9SS type A sorting domain-containing protein, partial [Bacteroidota bacterium]
AELQDVEWEEAQFDSDYEDLGSGRHRYMFDMGGTIAYIGKQAPSSNGIQSEHDPFYYYYSRFQYLDQEMVYGGYSPDGGGFWDGEENVSGQLFVNATSSEYADGLPREFALQQNYPNPFNPSTRIAFALPQQQHVRLEVYDLLGRRVALLVDEVRPAGAYTVDFDAAALTSGVYLYRITAGDFNQTRKMMLMK